MLNRINDPNGITIDEKNGGFKPCVFPSYCLWHEIRGELMAVSESMLSDFGMDVCLFVFNRVCTELNEYECFFGQKPTLNRLFRYSESSADTMMEVKGLPNGFETSLLNIRQKLDFKKVNFKQCYEESVKIRQQMLPNSILNLSERSQYDQYEVRCAHS